jgi:glycopeptide antibiotics resistance protein
MSSSEPRRARRPWLALAAGLAVLVVVLLLVWPTTVDGALVALVEAIFPPSSPWSATKQLVHFLANVALFVPLALIVALATRRWWLGLITGVAVSVGSELVQRTLPGRDASLEDVIANSLGTAIGAGIALAVARQQRARGAKR